MTSIAHINHNTIANQQKKFSCLKEVKSSYRAPWYLEIAKKIVAFITKLFNALCFWKWWKNDHLTKDQAQTLETIKNKEIRKVKLRYQKKRQLRFERAQQRAQHVSSQGVEEASKKKVRSIYEGREFDPSLNVLREFVGEFVENSMECLYEEKIGPAMNKRFEVADKIEQLLKKLSPFIVHLGNQAKVDIFEGLLQDQFNKQDTLSVTFKESLHRGLHWLLERDQQAESEKFLNEELRDGLVSRLIEKNIDAHEETIDRVINWIKLHRNKEYKHSLSSQTPDKEKEITHSVSQECISYLFETKIDILYQKVKHKLVDNLDTIIANFLKNNGRRVADEVSGRIAELLTEVQFEELLGKGLGLAYDHVKSYLATKDKIQKHIREAKIKHEKNEEVEQFIKDNIPLFYPTLPSTHPVVQDIYLGAHEDVNQDEWKQAIEFGGIREFVKNTYEVICSHVTVEIDGQPKTIDWLEYLFERMELPDEVNEIFDEVKSFVEQVLPEEDKSVTESIEKLCYNTSKEIAIAVARSQIKKVLSQLLYEFHKQLMSPEKISSLFSDHLLPVILEQTLQVHVENIVLHKRDTLVPLFNKLKKPEENEEEVLKALYQKVWEQVQANTNQFNFDSIGLNAEKFKTEYIESLVKSIHKAIKSDDLKNVPVGQIIGNLLATKIGHGDPRYSEMILDMVFKIGEFGGGFTQSVASLFTDEMNTVIGGTLKSLTEDNNFHLIDLAVAKLQKRLGSKELLRKVYFGKDAGDEALNSDNVGSSNQDANQSTVQQRLHGEIAKLSDIIHDIAFENINHQTSQSWMLRVLPTTRISKSVLGRDSTHLQNMLIKTFNKILFNEPMNSDFYFKIQDIMLTTLQTADSEARAKNRQLHNKKVEVIT